MFLLTKAEAQTFPGGRSSTVIVRLSGVALLVALELTALTILLDTRDLPRNTALLRFLGDWTPGILRAAIAFAALFFTFRLLTGKTLIAGIAAESTRPVSSKLLAGHALAMLAFCASSYLLFRFSLAEWQADLVASLWLATGACAMAFLGMALVPSEVRRQLTRASITVWVLCSLGGIAAFLIGDLGTTFWQPLADITFQLVGALLHPFVPQLVANPDTHTIGTDGFSVVIGAACSGYEGAGLILAFAAAWLWIFRRECRFPQALLVIPAGVLLVWLLNGVRIAALILIDSAGAPSVALGGFHSQAGWIVFNAVALGLSLLCVKRRTWTRIPSLFGRPTA